MLLQISKVANKLKCKRLFRKLLLLIHLPYKKYFSSVEDAEKYVNSLYPDVDNSCVCHNIIKRPYQYDLEIIIPVYNVEPYIEQCMQSVLTQQTQYTYVVVVVNDGSTDRSRNILKEYEDDERVKIIDQENQGLSCARNTALRNIMAKYVMFLDSDDFLAKGSIQNLMSVAINEDADIVEGSYIRFSRITNKIVKQKNGNLSPSMLRGYAWGKVIKSDWFEHIQFPLGYWFEDTLMRLVLYRLTRKNLGIEDVVYYHRSNPNGITHKAREHYKSMDSFYITRRLLKDEKLLNIEMTEELFLSLIERQIAINTIRISSVLDSKMNYAHFMLTCAMIDKIWGQKEFASNSEKANNIYKAIKESNYMHFIAYCIA